MQRTTIWKMLAPMAVIAAWTAPALAEEAYFKTPSGNIHCAYFDYDDPPEVRCDIQSFTPTMGKRPADCDLDWGDAFAVTSESKRGTMVCHGDTVISDQARTLAYGKTWKGDGIACSSETSGLTCKNAKGHGFSLSKAKQKVF